MLWPVERWWNVVVVKYEPVSEALIVGVSFKQARLLSARISRIAQIGLLIAPCADAVQG